MNGAESLIKTMIDAGVEVCFSNPGTSEMQLVAAIDKHDGIRPVLALFEGVATGAADGYGRMAGKPAATLLHLGPGLGNGMANLHNAKRARTPLVNIVGDHATYHLPYDAPLTSDVVGYSKPVSDWIRVAESSDSLAGDIAAAIAAASTHPGQIATLIVPANHAWDEASATSEPRAAADIPCVSSEAVDQAVAALLSGDPVAIMLGGMAFREGCLEIAGRIAEATGAILIGETFAARIQRGRGRVAFERLPYFGEMAADALKGFKHIILAGAKAPVSFFAYPGKPSWLAPDGCECPVLAEPEQDIQQALSRVADAVGAKPQVTVVQPAIVPDFPQGKLTAEGVRGGDRRSCDLPDDSRCGETRLAHAHRRCDRPGIATGARRRCRLSRSQGGRPASRRQRHVYGTVSMDDGARKPGCHDNHYQQWQLRNIEY